MHNSTIIKLNDNQLRKLQLELLNILLEFDRICNKHDIPYFLYAGTLLGAVRHNGFIPWDDDIDVAMLRNDYNKFQEIVHNELDCSKFFFQSQETDENYNWVFSRLRLNNTVYSRAGQEHLKCHNGFFIDIFPLDNISESKIKQNITKTICKMCKKTLWSPVGIVDGKNLPQKLTFRLLNLIPRKLVISIYNYFAIKFNSTETSRVASHNIGSFIFEKDWFNNIIRLEFEGYKFNSPVNYHELLEILYGDYLELPQKKNRIGHHYVTYIKFSDGTDVKI